MPAGQGLESRSPAQRARVGDRAALGKPGHGLPTAGSTRAFAGPGGGGCASRPRSRASGLGLRGVVLVSKQARSKPGRSGSRGGCAGVLELELRRTPGRGGTGHDPRNRGQVGASACASLQGSPELPPRASAGARLFAHPVRGTRSWIRAVYSCPTDCTPRGPIFFFFLSQGPRGSHHRTRARPRERRDGSSWETGRLLRGPSRARRCGGRTYGRVARPCPRPGPGPTYTFELAPRLGRGSFGRRARPARRRRVGIAAADWSRRGRSQPVCDDRGARRLAG